MKGVEFKDQTRVLGKPEKMSDNECSSLPVKDTENAGYPSLESVWELSDEELAMVNKSKRIRLGILGKGMPPVYIAVEQNEIPE